METEDYEGQIALINEYLDELDIPRKSKAGALYSTYGRVSLLGEKYNKAIALANNIHREAELCINHGIKLQFVQYALQVSSSVISEI